MKQKKTRKGLIITVSILAVLLTAGLIAAKIILDKSFSIVINNIDFGNDFSITIPGNSDADKNSGETSKQGATVDPESADGQGQNNNGGINANANNSKNESGNLQMQTDAEGNNSGITLSSEQIKEIESKMSIADKSAIMSILFSVLTKEQQETANAILTRGATQAELNEAMKILKSSLTSSQKSQIYALIMKYMQN